MSESPRAVRQAWRLSGGVVVVGLALGGVAGAVARLAGAAADPVERSSAAVVVTLALVAAIAPAVRGPRSIRAALAAVGGFAAGLAATLVAGAGSAGAALVVAGTAALACGARALLRRAGLAAGSAHVVAAAVPLALASAVLIADPFIEWTGGSAHSPAIARTIYRVNPIASATALEDGTGVDWQTRPWMYDGAGAGGLSVVGQYYPTRPTGPWMWGGVAVVAGVALGLAAALGRRSPVA